MGPQMGFYGKFTEALAGLAIYKTMSAQPDLRTNIPFWPW
jgi:hypothetical protein